LHILRCSQYIRLHNVNWIIIYELRINTDFEVGVRRLIEELTNYFFVCGLMIDATKDVQLTRQFSSSRWVLPRYKLRTSSPDAAPLQVVFSSFALRHYKCFTGVLKEQNSLILKIKILSSLNGSLCRLRVVRDVLQTRRISTQTANQFLRAGHFHGWSLLICFLKFKQDFSLNPFVSLFRVKIAAGIKTQSCTFHVVLYGSEQTVFLGKHPTIFLCNKTK
jgi:hypothetical protein